MHRLLIASDGQHLRTQLAHTVVARLPGWMVECVDSFDAALTSVDSNPPTAILVDLAAGGRRGLDMVTALRASRFGTTLVIIDVTGNQPVSYQRQLLDAGADHSLDGLGDSDALVQYLAQLPARLAHGDDQVDPGRVASDRDPVVRRGPLHLVRGLEHISRG